MTAQNFTVDNGITVNGTGGNITGATNIEASGNLTIHDITSSGNINGAGGLDIDGNATVGGNLFVTGNINFTGNVTQISGNSGVFYGNASTGSGALYAGKTGYTPVANTIVQITGDLDDYIQVNLQNTNHANTASMELAFTADDGDDTNNYLDMGIASSTWDGTQTNSLGTAVAARDGYLYVQGGATGGNLILGTTTAGYKIKFNAGGPNSANTVASISNVGIETNGIVSATGNVRGGNINTAGVVSAGGNITGNYILGNGSQLTGITSSYGNANVVANLAALGSNPVSTTGNITGGNVTSNGSIIRTGNISQAAWTTAGIGLTLPTATYTDTTTALGNLTASYVHAISAPSMAFSNVVTVTAATTLYVAAPTAGTNAVIGNSFAITASGQISATSNVITGGNIYLTTASRGIAALPGSGGYGANGIWGVFDHGVANAGTKTVNVGTGALLSTNTTTINIGTQYGSSNTTVYGNFVAANAASFSNTATITTSNYAIGYRDVPQITFSANANAALTDAGKHYYSTTAGNLALTLPDNSTTAFPTGTAMTIIVNAAGNVLVNAGTGVSLYLGGNSTSGNRVVGAYGMATVMKVAANVWFINGTGVS